jgi:hypothetical protein
LAHAVCAWTPVSWNEAVACEKTAGLKDVVVWHVEHTADRPVWRIAAVVVVWHDAQAVGVPRRVLVWQAAQAAAVWVPVSLKVLDACEKVVGFQPAVVWQVEHTVDRPVWAGLAGVV